MIKRFIVLSGFLFFNATFAFGQTACVTGANTTSCTVSNDTTLIGNVNTSGDNLDISVAGTVTNNVITNNDNSNITNTGTIGNDARTNGAGSVITNSGSIGRDMDQNGNNSQMTNSGTVGRNMRLDGANSTMTNSGTVTTNLRSQGPDNTIINTGTVGNNIRSFGASDRITNSGTIGNNIRTSGNNATITNSGTVTNNIRASGDNIAIINSGAVDNTIRADDANAVIINSGSVGNDITSNGDNVVITNSGTVIDIIDMNGNNAMLNLLGGSFIGDRIRFDGGGTKTLNIGTGLNVDLTVNGAPTVITSSGFSFVGNQLTVVDPTGFASTDVMIGTLTSTIFNTVDQNATGLDANLNISSQGKKTSANEAQVWGLGFGGIKRTQGRGNTAGINTNFAGIIAGFDRGQFGAFGGYSIGHSDAEFNAQDTDVESIFGGVYWNTQLNTYHLRLALAAGTADHEYDRRINNPGAPGGIETAQAEYDGWFLSPSATLSTPLTWIPSAPPMIGSLRLSYTGVFLDGFTETGATTPLTVNSRDIHILGLRGQIKIPRSINYANGAYVKLEMSGGFDGRISIGSNTVEGTLNTNTISFDARAEDEISGFLGGAYTYTSPNGLTTLQASTEAQIALTGGFQINAGLRAIMRF